MGSLLGIDIAMYLVVLTNIQTGRDGTFSSLKIVRGGRNTLYIKTGSGNKETEVEM